MTYPTRDEIAAVLEPFVHVANGYDNELDPDDRPVGPFMLGLCRRARDLLARLQSAEEWQSDHILCVLKAIAEGYPTRGELDRYVIVDNPKYQPDDGSNPSLVIDVDALAAAPSPIPEQQEGVTFTTTTREELEDALNLRRDSLEQAAACQHEWSIGGCAICGAERHAPDDAAVERAYQAWLVAEVGSTSDTPIRRTLMRPAFGAGYRAALAAPVKGGEG